MAEKKTTKAKPVAAKGPESKRKAAAPVPAAAPPPEVVPTEYFREAHGFRRKIIGTVVSAKMAKTVVVEVIRKAMHPVYKKYVRVRNKYKAHDELNQFKAGDRVEIMEHRPISREKRWTVTRLISRPVEA
jgi:small subunit ribosomal protein S17